nr:unnamed protein product [Spirometra erinaceieuropaei]
MEIFRETASPAHFEEFRRQRNAVKKCIRQARKEYESKIIRQAEQKPKILFHYLNSRLKNKDPVAVLKDDNGVEIIENSEKAEHLGQYFVSLFARETEFRSCSASNAVETAGPVLDSILFATAVVERELKNLKEAKSSGPDNIPAKFLKELANELSKPLAYIFRSSFELGRLPSEWKTVNIFPIYKGGARTNANNYLPVSLTCICCKIMETIVKKATMKFLEQGHLLSDLQQGFRQNRLCLSSLFLSTEQWTRALDEDGRVDGIYADFKKAFESVPHKRLIYKLSEIGIRGRLLTWITDFLTGRSQTVYIEASRSNPTPVLSGAPQGSVLGPLLFLVYINDCVDDLGCSAIMLADDVKLWRPIRSDADRQLRGDLIQTYRIVRGRECALHFDEFFELAGTDRLRGHPFQLQRKLVHSDVRRNAFSLRKSFLKFWVLNPLIDSTVAMAFVVSEHYGRSHQLFLNASTLTTP